ncbi:ankyrin repeat domain-containing protein 24-like isoform X2 [Actinia tenebrosa]|uniref:Ankyrin repeat domain-containing protein 24-like isoform X2 n=1 Tax=Actinia tenebrosa TaxID=6105 RepID=A0A6P8I346_ACTTE|nr:ankyrin repeat domain-containing protein 24-like isoform X2 [Actinia tenebrosa]
MKKIKGKLVKRSSQTNLHVDSSLEWSKYDERLMECVHQNDVVRLRATIAKKPVSVIKLSPNGTTALHTACEKGNVECLEIMLKENPDLSIVDRSGCIALGLAAKQGSVECIEKILEYNSDTIGFQDYHKKTALHYAAAKGHYDCVNRLLENDKYIDVRDKDGRTPLLMGIQSGKEDVVKLLLDKGAKVNITDNSKKTALMYASLLGHEKSVDLLLKRGANSNLQDSNGHTAEDYARIIGYKDIITAIRNAPTVATWDAGDDNEEEKEEEKEEISNGELVLAFNSHEEEDDTSVMTNHNNSRNISPKMVSSVGSERVSLQDSFSSKASTTMSSLTMQRDLTIDIKELEEENEMLNQELTKLRVQHQKTIERLRITEDELNSVKKKPLPPDIIHINGSMDNDDLIEKKERRIEELETQISKLKIELVTETRAKQNAEAKEENNRNSLSDDELDDLDLPGVDEINSSDKTPQKVPSPDILSSLNDEISMLKRQNQSLKQQLKEQISREINHNDLIEESSIPLQVYQQLKDSSEEEIFSLSEQIEELKIKNEELEIKITETVENCQQCLARQKTDAEKGSDTSHKKYLESEVKRLRKKMKEKVSEFERTLSLYRLHLLSSVQGELDPDVNEALQMIISLRASEQFC